MIATLCLKTTCTLCGINPTYTSKSDKIKQETSFSLCMGCLKDLPLRKGSDKIVDLSHFSSTIDNKLNVLAACRYCYPTDELIIAYKYRGDLRLLSAMVDIFKTLPKPPVNTLLVPMPSTKSRLNERGFDHILMLTKALGKHWQLPLWQGIKRHGNALNQKGLSRRERLKNISGQFELKRSIPMGHKLLLIDDVCTTGASLSALAGCLRASGQVEHLLAYVLAH